MQASNIARGPIRRRRRRRGLASMLLLWLLAASGYAHAASYVGEPIVQPAANCESSTAPQAAVRTGAWYPEVKVCRDSDTFWIIVARRRGSERTAAESTHFSVGQGRFGYGFGVEAIVVDAPDRFHVQFTYGSASVPNSDVIRFIWLDNAWWIAGRDFSTLARCADGSIDTSSRYSVNYLTKRAVATLYDGCRFHKTVRASLHAMPPTLQGFDPLDPALRPKQFAAHF
jgi:hypothetical protein